MTWYASERRLPRGRALAVQLVLALLLWWALIRGVWWVLSWVLRSLHL
jgi:hypothetical protein